MTGSLQSADNAKAFKVTIPAGLPDGQKWLLAVLYDYADQAAGGVDADHERLISVCGFTKSAYHRHLSALKTSGFVISGDPTVDHFGKKHRTIRVNYEALKAAKAAEVKQQNPPPKSAHNGPSKDVSAPFAATDDLFEKSFETPKFSSERKDYSADIDAGWQAFWRAYPSSAGKAEAERNFRLAVAGRLPLKGMKSAHHHTPVPIADLVRGAEGYRAEVSRWPANTDKTVKHAQGWLTDRRWRDYEDGKPIGRPERSTMAGDALKRRVDEEVAQTPEDIEAEIQRIAPHRRLLNGQS